MTQVELPDYWPYESPAAAARVERAIEVYYEHIRQLSMELTEMTESQMSPAMKKLMAQSGAWNSARTQKNPFKNKLDLPDGLFFGRVKKGRLTLTQKKDPMSTITVVTIADTDGRVCDDEGNSFAGEQAKLMTVFKETEKASLADQHARFCYDLQALNYDTSQLDVSEVEEALAQVEADAKFCVISVKMSDDKQRQFINLQEETTLEAINEALVAAGNEPLDEEAVEALAEGAEAAEEETDLSAEVADDGSGEGTDDTATAAAGGEDDGIQWDEEGYAYDAEGNQLLQDENGEVVYDEGGYAVYVQAEDAPVEPEPEPEPTPPPRTVKKVVKKVASIGGRPATPPAPAKKATTKKAAPASAPVKKVVKKAVPATAAPVKKVPPAGTVKKVVKKATTR